MEPGKFLQKGCTRLKHQKIYGATVTREPVPITYQTSRESSIIGAANPATALRKSDSSTGESLRRLAHGAIPRQERQNTMRHKDETVHETLERHGFGHRRVSDIISRHEVFHVKTGLPIGKFHAADAATLCENLFAIEDAQP